ncbi:TLC domain-containing protein [Morchella snyderi]|nr:TLC domain-containing protein [Morchella snyderi]
MDAFIFPCPEWFSSLSFVQSLSEALNLPTLPAHIHYILLAFCTYHSIFLFVSPFFSRLLLPNIYPNFSRRTKINWDVRVVSFVQSTFISILALWVIFNDEERAAWREQGNTDAMLGRVFGETPMCGAVTGYAAGYFLWDLFMSGYYLSIFGPGFLAHAASAVAVYSLGFRPFVNFYAPVFVLFELSSPFLNIHWFCDKVGLTGSKVQLYNGFLLIGTFFGCRICYGTWSGFLVMKDVWSTHFDPPSVLTAAAKGADEVIPHVFEGLGVPFWLAVVYLTSNSILNLLNYFWFTRMIQTVASRFTGNKGAIKEVSIEGHDLKIASAIEKPAARKRKA